MQWEASSQTSWLAADPPQRSVPPGANADAGTLDLELSGPWVAVPPPDVG